MLKPNEIKGLSNKLNYDLETTKHCLNILFSENSSTIDNELINEAEVDEFLRICIRSKSKKIRERLFYGSIHQKLANLACQNKNGNQIKTIVYLIRDNFFSALLAYLDAIERKKFKQKFERKIVDNLDSFYFTMPNEYMNYNKLNRKKNDIVNLLLIRILNEVDLSDYRCDFEEEYIVKLSTELVREIGFQIFVSDIISECFIEMEELGRSKNLLDLASKGLVSYRKNTRREYIFVFCLCETLKHRGYKMKDAYKKLNEILNMAASSIKSRYYELRDEMSNNGIDYRDLIRRYGLAHKIDSTIEKMNKM